MARTTREGDVFLQDDSLEEDVREGHVEKIEGGRWRAWCALDDQHSFIEDSKADAVAKLDVHFVRAHTTLNS